MTPAQLIVILQAIPEKQQNAEILAQVVDQQGSAWYMDMSIDVAHGSANPVITFKHPMLKFLPEIKP